MQCPTCNGEKKLFPVFVSYAEGFDGPPVEFLPCHMCNGSGQIPNERMHWIEHGKKLRDKRLAAEIGIRKFADDMGVTCTYVSRVERGEFDNLAINWNV